PYMLASHLPDVAVLVDKDRVKSGRYAINRQGRDTLVLDDGFQYFALEHRIKIVLVDKQNPFGNGYVLPRGILREPVKNISRANVIFITKCDGKPNDELRAKLRSFNRHAEIIECTHRARYLQNVFVSSEQQPVTYLDGMPITAVSGIAAPEGFENELERLGAKIMIKERFADHHRYSQRELSEIVTRSVKAGVAAVITTEKDAVRFPKLERHDVPVFFLRVDIELLSGKEDFNACISRICFKKRDDN
ncbi:MAG: tetraacyldisaccharide 4'-kinase, partial [bacterium]